MSTQERLLLAVAVVLIDLTLFVLPLTGLFAAYILLARPPWFFAWVKELYGPRS
ncbi:MAG: hypothetical protein AB1Z65_17395 [Candidatus Sulfomarinibacteraceae bacterium]